MKKYASIILLLIGVLSVLHYAQARGRYGSHRIGGYTNHGRGSHYIGGYARSGAALRTRHKNRY